MALQSLNILDKNEQDDIGQQAGLQKFYRNSKYEVSAAEWAICEGSKEYCAIAVSELGFRKIRLRITLKFLPPQTSQLIEVVTWSGPDPLLIHSLRAHTRMVTDIDWHSKVPHLLASCSIDTFTHLWDLRDPRKPIMSLSAVCMCKSLQVPKRSSPLKSSFQLERLKWASIESRGISWPPPMTETFAFGISGRARVPCSTSRRIMLVSTESTGAIVKRRT